MSIYYFFYVESRATGEWEAPTELQSSRGWSESERQRGCFNWTKHYPDLFLGTSPLFPMRGGFPSDVGHSRLISDLQRWGDEYIEDNHPHWIPYNELFIDSWDTFLLTVRGGVSAGFAPLFGEGTNSFPRDELLAAGMAESGIEKIRENPSWTELPINVAFGAERNRIERLPAEARVGVTWQETTAEYLRFDAPLFTSLRAYGADEDLRILCTWG